MLRSCSNLNCINIFYLKCRYRDGYLNRVLAPEGEILFFAPPKKSIQKKGGPVAACFLRSSLSPGVARRAIPGPLATRCIHAAPLRAVPGESSGTRRGIRDSARSHALRGNAVKGALRRQLNSFLLFIQAVRQTGQKLSMRNISSLT
jgi:hypothetical protein